MRTLSLPPSKQLEVHAQAYQQPMLTPEQAGGGDYRTAAGTFSVTDHVRHDISPKTSKTRWAQNYSIRATSLFI
eukprot:1138687-Pelagomonas_calceolata.AAC.5